MGRPIGGSRLTAAVRRPAGAAWWVTPAEAGRCAQAFTTGSRSGGYTLKSVTAEFIAKVEHSGTLGNIIVAVHAADTTDSANPAATAKVTLNGSDPDTAGLYTYTCTGSDCSLAKDTKYFVVMSTADTDGVKFYQARLTASDAEAGASVEQRLVDSRRGQRQERQQRLGRPCVKPNRPAAHSGGRLGVAIVRIGIFGI